MNATAQATAEPPSLDPVYTTRDDIARTHNPATPYERMLLTAAAQAWQRFQQALDLEKRLFAQTDPLELFSANLNAFKSITRHVSVCDSAFRRAMEQLERAQRARARQDLGCGRPRTTPPAPENRQNEPERAAAASVACSSQPKTQEAHDAETPRNREQVSRAQTNLTDSIEQLGTRDTSPILEGVENWLRRWLPSAIGNQPKRGTVRYAEL